MKQKSLLILLFTVFIPALLFAQFGGQTSYNFLNFAFSSRGAALGGGLVSVNDKDLSLAISNPATISSLHHNKLVLNFADYFANVNYGSALYSHTFKKAGSLAFEMRCIGYGRFEGYDESGMETGEFTAGDYAATVGWGRYLDKGFSVGANLKMVYCSYEDFNSFGLAVDVGGNYYNEDKRLSLSLLFKNIGSEIVRFTPNQYQKMPFDIQFALSQRFEHLPVRYHISLHHLYRWDLSNLSSLDPYLDRDAITGEMRYPSKVAQFADNLFRHFVFGIEIEPSKYFSLLFSYNHQRNREMRIPQKKSMAGFSYGFSININAFGIGFSRSHFAVGAVPNYITFAIDFEELTKNSKEKKKKKL
ncbi:type IX secretion system protein PorQ, partial [Bacteroidales bacterium OttesenSCG-928-A14]|nr:type IX secretion system protein PorQ [Bacteroidales bacterium OttesenSCG-928-A14]